MQIAFPYQIDGRGLTTTTDTDDHIRQMIEQLLLTRPGERVNRPTFGCGVADLLFGPNSPEVAAALELTIGAAIQVWLGDIIQLAGLEVVSSDSTVRVNLSYNLRATGAATTAVVVVPAAG